MWIVAFPRNIYTELEEFLFSTTPYENGCFLLAQAHYTKKRSLLLVTDILRPTKGSWNNRGLYSLVPSSSFINECVVRSGTTGSSLVFVHTHPDTAHPPEFSKIDKRTNRRLFANLSEIVPKKPLGSLVFSKQGVSGVVFDRAKTMRVGRVKVVGTVMTESGVDKVGTGSPGMMTEFDRQIRAFGIQGQQKIQDMVATVVGVGGTGSSVAIQLARMGVGRIILVDMDNVDESNLPRIYGSKKTDIGETKVNVLKRHIVSFSRSKITAAYGDVIDDSIRDLLIESDVIFGCTDNHTSRHTLNDVSIRFYIPLIDVGCRIDLDGGGSISQAVAKVQTITPDSACLWCTGTLNGKTILQESLSDKERKRLAEEGYYESIDKQPSVISLTTLAASIAVNKFLGLVGMFGDQTSTRVQIELKDGFMISDAPEIKANCVCRKNKGAGFNA